LINFDNKFDGAMKFIFGSTFVAEDTETAKKVAMENPIQKFNCVTLKGDLYRCDGALTGGMAAS